MDKPTEMVGAIKIKDALFLGDEFAAQVRELYSTNFDYLKDLEFVITNKVTHIINCAGKQIPNHWEPIGVQYVTYRWMDNDK